MSYMYTYVLLTLYRAPGYVLEFTDPLLLRIILSPQLRSQLQHIVDTYSVLLHVGPANITLSPNGSSDNSAAAKEDLVALTQSVMQSISTEPLLLHCSNIPLLVSDPVICAIQRIDAQYGVDISVVTTSGEFVSFSEFVPKVSALVSGSDTDNMLLLSQVSCVQFAEMKLNHNWCYEVSGQMKDCPPSVNDLLNNLKNYNPLHCGFTFDSIQYKVDFSRMKMVQEGCEKDGEIAIKPPLWTFSDTCVPSKFSRPFDTATSQEIDLAMRHGIPRLLQLGESKVSFNFLEDPVVLYDVTRGDKWFLHREPPLPTPRDCVVTLAIRCRNDDRPQVVQALKAILQEQMATQIYTIPPNIRTSLVYLLVNMARQFCIQSRVVVDVDTSAVTIHLQGEKEYVRAVKMHLLEEFQQKIVPLCVARSLSIPHQWEPQQTSDVETIPVPVSGEEWCELETLMQESLPSAKLVEVLRIQNLTLWRRYSFFKSLMSRKNQGEVNEKLLFHGTRHTNPQTIISSEKGFDFRYGSDDSFWGKGTYFAVKASYCDSRFVYKTNEGTKQVFIARVLTGKSVNIPKPNRTLKEPPKLPGSDTDAYDSVNGLVENPTHTQVYVIYDHDKAYPAYLLTYWN